MPENDNDEPTPQESANMAELRAAAERGRAAQAEADAARRELAFLKAGITTDTGPGKLLLKSYDGDLTPEAVLAAAAEYGIAPQPAQPPAEAPAPAPAFTAEDAAAARERAELVSGSEPPGGPADPDPIQTGLDRFYEDRKSGKSSEQAAKSFIDTVFSAAAAGDERALHDPVRWRQEMGVG
jgi:hypothetical protein